jgi:hypothetical protein
MDINFERRYAYSEVCVILNWLGDDYKRKVPKNLLRLFKDERKFGYKPEIDFDKPLDGQVRQETKNLIAYLEYYCWLEDPEEKKRLKEATEQNYRIKKEKEKQEKQAIINKNVRVGLNAQLNDALKNLK